MSPTHSNEVFHSSTFSPFFNSHCLLLHPEVVPVGDVRDDPVDGGDGDLVCVECGTLGQTLQELKYGRVLNVRLPLEEGLGGAIVVLDEGSIQLGSLEEMTNFI